MAAPSAIPASLEAGWTQTGGIHGLEVVGREGTIYNTTDGYRFVAPGKTPEPIAPGEAQLTRVDRLVAIVRGEVPAAELAADLPCILDTVAITSACYESADTGVWTAV